MQCRVGEGIKQEGGEYMKKGGKSVIHKEQASQFILIKAFYEYCCRENRHE